MTFLTALAAIALALLIVDGLSPGFLDRFDIGPATNGGMIQQGNDDIGMPK